MYAEEERDKLQTERVCISLFVSTHIYTLYIYVLTYILYTLNKNN